MCQLPPVDRCVLCLKSGCLFLKEKQKQLRHLAIVMQWFGVRRPPVTTEPVPGALGFLYSPTVATECELYLEKLV